MEGQQEKGWKLQPQKGSPKQEAQPRLNPNSTGNKPHLESRRDPGLYACYQPCHVSIQLENSGSWGPQGLPSSHDWTASIEQPASETETVPSGTLSQLVTAACWVLIPEMPSSGGATGCLSAYVLAGLARNSNPAADIGEADGPELKA